MSQDQFWYPWKGLVTRNTHAKCKSPSTYHSRYIDMLKFSVSRSNTKVKVTRSKIPTERSCRHKEHSCEISEHLYILIKRYSQGYTFQEVGQIPRLRSQGQKFCTHRKVLSQGLLMWNIKVLLHSIQKI
jgi:hypothetical protein